MSLSCYECAFKHLSMASRVWSEIQLGYDDDSDHIAAFVGDMAWASEHLRFLQPDMAESIRQDRIAFLSSFLGGEWPPKKEPNFDEYFRQLLSLMLDVVDKGRVAERQTQGS